MCSLQSNIFLPQCNATSVGTASQLFLTLLQALMPAQFSTTPKSIWPRDYGNVAVKEGKNSN